MSKGGFNMVKGLALALVLAVVSSILGNYLISAAVVALLLGMAIRYFIKDISPYSHGLNFASKKILRISIILLGSGLSLDVILRTGMFSLIVMVFTLLAAFGCGHIIGKWFKMDWRLSSLISAGTGICGGSAIAALSPVIEADESQVAYAISATFIFDIIMVILFPLMGRALGLSDLAFGLWAGTAINDTSSVVAASYAFSDAAGEFATIVKLTRTLALIPIIVIFSIITTKKNANAKGIKSINLSSVFPWFIVLFLLLAIINTIGFIPAAVSAQLSSISKFLMVIALGAIGLKTDINKLRQSGFLPMLHGFLISAIVVVVSLAVQIFIGQV
ncbi:MAG: hypothetical protein ATN34_03125 [Epulopiscium sp. Nele67-Bin002]|nr:MAG: hypothetical protein BEN18_06640 [Epulopiscium sp. Nuni2H_MBin001]OON90671.1 MAG: hypothetical protein ATN34_03125 [Epulopiscium sp. Nele67-Bin002]OON93370.1 MAG: hypothetical protein ATN33_05890 [Epulopiscium sp. Nele67-Bin001]